MFLDTNKRICPRELKESLICKKITENERARQVFLFQRKYGDSGATETQQYKRYSISQVGGSALKGKGTWACPCNTIWTSALVQGKHDSAAPTFKDSFSWP